MTPLNMALEGTGLTHQKLSHSLPVLGYSDKTTVKLDFDDTPFKTVKYWALRAMRWFRLRGFIILRSSKNHYHVVFDRSVTWERNMHIVAWVALESGSHKLQKYHLMQCIKESSTLRVSGKRGRPHPRIVFSVGNQGNEIRRFLFWRRQIKKEEKTFSYSQKRKERERQTNRNNFAVGTHITSS
jgi:hypothetical protein